MHQRKNPEDRIGHPHGAFQDVGPVTKGHTKRYLIPAIPEASPNWLPQARSWYNSLRLSGQSDYYEASDWATAVAAAQAYDVFLRTYNASILTIFERLSQRLGATIVDRKRSRIELAGPEAADVDDEAADASVLRWHERLGAPIHPVPDPDPPKPA